MDIVHVLGNTYYVNSKYCAIPFYKLDDKRIILLDSGWPGEPMRELAGALAPFEVAGIISTHAHSDHVGANAYYKERGAVIAMPAFEAHCIASLPNLKAWYPLFTFNEIKEFFGDIICPTDIFIEPDADSVELLGCKFEILYTPGHTPQHICVRTPDDVLYLSDALMSSRDCEKSKLPYAYSMELDEQTRDKLRAVKASAFILGHGGLVDEIGALIEENAACWRRCFDDVVGFFSEPLNISGAVKAAIERLNIKSCTNFYSYRIVERNVRSFVDYLVDCKRLTAVIRDNEIWYYNN